MIYQICSENELLENQSMCGACSKIITSVEVKIVVPQKKTKAQLRREQSKRKKKEHKDVATRKRKAKEHFEEGMAVIKAADGKLPEVISKLRIKSPISGKMVWMYKNFLRME